MAENQKTNMQYTAATLAAVFVTWELHEFFHWLAGEMLGNAMQMTLNSAYPVNEKYLMSWHAHVVDGAGPLVTLAEAVVVFFLLRKNKTVLLFPFLLTCLYMRALAGAMNVINPNDEGRLSLALGTDVFFLSVIMTGVLFYITYKIVKLRKIPAKIILISLLWIILFSSALILGDQFFRVVIIR